METKDGQSNDSRYLWRLRRSRLPFSDVAGCHPMNCVHLLDVYGDTKT